MKYLLLVLGLISSGFLYANSPITERKVTRLMFHDSGYLYVYFEGTVSHAETCDDKNVFVLAPNTPNYEMIYSGLLAAMHAKAPVYGYVNGCIDIWGRTKVKITRMDFLPV